MKVCNHGEHYETPCSDCAIVVRLPGEGHRSDSNMFVQNNM